MRYFQPASSARPGVDVQEVKDSMAYLKAPTKQTNGLSVLEGLVGGITEIVQDDFSRLQSRT